MYAYRTNLTPRATPTSPAPASDDPRREYLIEKIISFRRRQRHNAVTRADSG